MAAGVKVCTKACMRGYRCNNGECVPIEATSTTTAEGEHHNSRSQYSQLPGWWYCSWELRCCKCLCGCLTVVQFAIGWP